MDSGMLYFNTEDGGRILLQSFGDCLLGCIVEEPRRPQYKTLVQNFICLLFGCLVLLYKLFGFSCDLSTSLSCMYFIPPGLKSAGA